MVPESANRRPCAEPSRDPSASSGGGSIFGCHTYVMVNESAFARIALHATSLQVTIVVKSGRELWTQNGCAIARHEALGWCAWLVSVSGYSSRACESRGGRAHVSIGRGCSGVTSSRCDGSERLADRDGASRLVALARHRRSPQ